MTPAMQAEKRISLWGNPVPTHLVNLDAVIRREDFEATSDPIQQPSQLGNTLKVNELEVGSLTYQTLRKPDFQRETASWKPEKVTDLILSFLDGDLIPSIILWRSPGTGNIFVIDGAHRLGALIAWVHDDYGDGKISRTFFDNRIPSEQTAAADKTRSIIKKSIGTYEELKVALQYPSNSTERAVRRARNLSAFAVPLQWVNGDATKAEASFFKINQLAAPINETELKILESRNRPNALAARAIIRAGTGHKYWAKFNETARTEIESLSKEINDALFLPPLSSPIKTLDLPIAGRVYSAQALPLLFDLVNITNDVRPEKKEKKKPGIVETGIADDSDGTKTIQFLKNTKRLVRRISSTHPSSLGLHPAVYFYSANGRHQPTSFLAVVSLMKDFEKKDRFVSFTKHRRQIEDFILKYKEFPNQIVSKFGSGLKGFAILERLFSTILDGLENNNKESQIVDLLRKDDKLSFLKLSDMELEKARRDFTTDIKSAAFLKSALENPVRCRICKCLIHPNATTIDHIEGKKDGGIGTLDNAQLAHPYCNGTFKEQGHAVVSGISSNDE